MSTEFARILAELADPTAVTDHMSHEHSPFFLADKAGCGSPDGMDSPGARFLADIARDVAEWVGQWNTPDDTRDALSDIGDQASEMADRAVPIYTHERWATFTDLAAWDEDPSELGVDGSDMTAAAGVALYMIAERLVYALAEELSEALEADAEAREDADA